MYARAHGAHVYALKIQDVELSVAISSRVFKSKKQRIALICRRTGTPRAANLTNLY